MTLPALPFPRPTAQVEPYVNALGLETATQFILMFGGAELNIPNSWQNTRLAVLLGEEKARALSQNAYLFQRRVPLANEWLARVLHYQGTSVNEIARKLRITDVTVRKYLKRG